MRLAGSSAHRLFPDAAPAAEVDLSVVVPVRDETACLAPLWTRLHRVVERLGRSWEVVFVDDGSRDGSLERLRTLRAREPRIRLLALSVRSGQSAALDAGFRAARGRWIVTLDADLQNPPEEIPRLFDAAGESDLVFGRRRQRADSRIKRIASRLGNAVRNRITGEHVADSCCSLKLFRVAALRRIPAFSGMHRFLPSLFTMHGFTIREIDVDHEPRIAGASKYGIGDRALRGLVDCFGLRWLARRSLDYRAREIED